MMDNSRAGKRLVLRGGEGVAVFIDGSAQILFAGAEHAAGTEWKRRAGAFVAAGVAMDGGAADGDRGVVRDRDAIDAGGGSGE
jgi:hypothetical protein